jgi:cell division septation protein DedD
MQVNFYVIAGSFKSSENAAAMAGRLRTMGYAPELLEAPNGFTRVAAMGFADIETASAEMRRLAPSVEGLWILRK